MSIYWLNKMKTVVWSKYVQTLTSIIFMCITNGSFAVSDALNCKDVVPAVQIHAGVYVRPSNDGIIFENKNIANIGFIVGEKEIAVIDSGGSISEAQQLRCKIRQVSDLPIRYLINTHVHPDHTMGNSVFGDPQIKFIGHKNLKRAIGVLSKTYLRRYNGISGKNLSEESILLPTIEVQNELEIDLGNRKLTLIAVQKAHTDNDLVVYDKKTHTLWLSDLLFHKHIPVIGKSGSINGWLDFIKKIKDKKIKNIIPGHGPLKLDLVETSDNQVRYLTLLRDEIRKNINDDADLNKAVETIGLDESSKWNMFLQFHKRNISYIFSELEWE